MAVRWTVEAAPGFRDKRTGGGIVCQAGNEHIGEIGASAEEFIKRAGFTTGKHGDGLHGKAALQKTRVVGKGDGDGQDLADTEAMSGVKGFLPQKVDHLLCAVES